MMARPSGARKSRALAVAERHRHHPSNQRERRHQNRPESRTTGLDDRLAPQQPFSSDHFAKSMSRIAFFATMPIKNDADEALRCERVAREHERADDADERGAAARA